MTLATQKILGGGQTIPVPVSLPDGVYSITLISYDPTHAAGVQVEQTAEQWVLEAFAGEQLVYTSPPITDLAEAALSLIEEIDHDVALSGVTSLRARHVGGGLNSIMPVCASFERTGDLSSPGTTGLDAPSTPSDQSITCPEGTKPEADADDQQQQQDPDDLP